jgi:hypothetical protein
VKGERVAWISRKIPLLWVARAKPERLALETRWFNTVI